jgi:hypothetical protein
MKIDPTAAATVSLAAKLGSEWKIAAARTIRAPQAVIPVVDGVITLTIDPGDVAVVTVSVSPATPSKYIQINSSARTPPDAHSSDDIKPAATMNREEGGTFTAPSARLHPASVATNVNSSRHHLEHSSSEPKDGNGFYLMFEAMVRCAFSDRNLHARMPFGSHACSLEANMRVTNAIPFGCPLLLPVGTVNRVQTRKVQRQDEFPSLYQQYRNGIIVFSPGSASKQLISRVKQALNATVLMYVDSMARCSVFDSDLYSRMLSDRTPAFSLFSSG